MQQFLDASFIQFVSLTSGEMGFSAILILSFCLELDEINHADWTLGAGLKKALYLLFVGVNFVDEFHCYSLFSH